MKNHVSTICRLARRACFPMDEYQKSNWQNSINFLPLGEYMLARRNPNSSYNAKLGGLGH